MSSKSYSRSWAKEEEEMLMMSSDSHGDTQRSRKSGKLTSSSLVDKYSIEQETVRIGETSLDGVSGAA